MSYNTTSEEELLNTWSVDFTPLDRWEFRQRSNRLEESLLSRVSLSVLSQRGILDDSELAASLHSVASKLNHKLAHRSSLIDLQNKNILPNMDQSDDAQLHEHVDGIYHKRKESLSEALGNRPELSEIADLGYIDDSGMAPRLQPTALRLNRRLTERRTRDDLILQGIIQPPPDDDDNDGDGDGDNDGDKPPSDPADEVQPASDEHPVEEQKKKKKKGKRNSRSEKHEKTPSILWRDVKKKKSKKIDNKSTTTSKQKDVTVSSMNGGDSNNNNGESGISRQYRVGDRVRLTKGRSGTIRYIGKPHFAQDERIGIELDQWSAKGHDGRVGKFRYFSTKYGHGTFVTISAIIEKLKSSTNTSSTSQFKIGDYVLMKDNRKGIIRYIGSTGIVKGCLVGIELDEKSPAGHDGRFGGKNYFECPEGHGIFVRLMDVVKIIKTAQQIKDEQLLKNQNIETIPDDIEMSGETISDALSIGDRVTLANDKHGIIKYIGNTEFSDEKEPMIGIELDENDATDKNAGDGSVGNKTYFKTQMGRAIFVRRASVVSVNNKDLQELIKDIQSKKKRGSITLDEPEEGDNDNDEEEDDDEEDEDEDDEDDDDDDEDIEVGDYVELNSGIKGIIKFIGSTDFAKGELIGLEMETWDSDGHDGSKHNKRYFQCKQGHGMWTRRKAIKRYLKIPPHLKHVDIKQLLYDTKTGKKKNLMETYQEIEEKAEKAENGEDGNIGNQLGSLSITTGGSAMFENAKVGDRVELDRKKMGTIRYIGQVKFNTSSEVIGIELDKYLVSAHDGKGYFETKKGHGYAIFITRKEIKRLIPMDKLVTPRHLKNNSTFGGNRFYSLLHQQPSLNVIHIDDRVRLKNGRTGVIRWKGILPVLESEKQKDKVEETEEEQQEEQEEKEKEKEAKKNQEQPEQFGIELDISDSSGNNGYYGNSKYFNCAPNRGLFVTLSEIVENLGSTTSEWLHHKYTISRDITLKENFRIQTLIGGSGIIRYLGNPGFVDDLMYGIELDQWSPNATNGFVNGQEFFQCEQGKGFFVGKESIIKHLTVDDSELLSPDLMDLPQLKKMPRMHDKVKLVDGQIGIIRFIGMLEFSPDTFIGIKLDQWSPNGNDGSAAGKKYFKCEPGHGYFVKLIDIAANLGSIISTPFKNKDKEKFKKTENLLKVGDKVKLENGEQGIVKYIGTPHFAEDEMVGIELDQWSANGHNGKVKGRTYFRSAPGCGTFARRGSIAHRISPDFLKALANDHEDNQANDGDDKSNNNNLPDPGDKVKLKNGNVGIVQWIEDNSSKKDIEKQIQIQLLNENEEDDNNDNIDDISTIKVTDISENLGCQTTQDSVGVSDDDIKIGAHVRLIRGKTGYIRYIGSVGNVDELIGIELDSWTHNGHDGKGNFKCQIGRGYFTKRTNIIGIISATEKSTQEQLQLKRHRNIRKLRKKLRKISMLEQKAKNGLKLNSSQQQQLLNKIEYERQLQELQHAFARNIPAIQIDDIVKHDIVSVQKIPEVAMYDTVILDTGERGKVVFIGDVHFDDHEMLGIKLDKWSPNAHNGSIDGKSYFVAPEGRGLLVPLSAVHDVINKHNEEEQKEKNHDNADTENKPKDDTNPDDRGLSNLQVGDEVQLGSKTGTVRYLGTTEFSKDEPVLGIELNEWSANANDGTINGKKYFEASPGKGFFMRKQSYMNLADMINASDFTTNQSSTNESDKNILRRDSVIIHDVSNILPIEYELGDKVRLENGDTGIIRFIGKTSFCPDKLIGLELDQWNPNGHNGTYKATPYFDAVQGRGFFVRHDLIISKIDRNNPMPLSTLHINQGNIRPPNVKKGDRIRLKNGLVGIVKFKGKVEFAEEEYLGLELESKHYNGTDGKANGVSYFSVKKKRGYFAKRTEVARILTSFGAKSLKQMKKVKSLSDFPKLEDRVKTIKGKIGVVKYVGTTTFAKGTLIGLELSQWWPNGHDGSVKNHRYFQCPAGRGYFTRLSHLIENFGPNKKFENSKDDIIFDQNAITEVKSSAVTSADPNLPQFKVGDRVKLQHGKTGVVRYIGKPNFSQEELVGIELDTWSANAGDGSVSGEQIFDTSAGRGYFTRRKSVANIIASKITEGAYARLKGLVRVPKFNGKTVKIVAYVEKKGRWKVKLLHAKQEKKYLGVREENLDPILDWEPVGNDEQNKQESLSEAPMIGDKVKTRKGKYGICKYVGPVDFAPNSSTIHIGLELEQWDPNGHNGTVKGKKYFITMDGRGYFVKLDNLIENLGKPKTLKEIQEEERLKELSKPKAPLPEPPKVKLGDHVKLARGRTGIVKYVGVTDFSNGKEVIGLELDTYDAEGNEKHQKYFNAPKGRGYFTKRESIAHLLDISSILDSNNNNHDHKQNKDNENNEDLTVKRLISRTKKKLREIEVLEFKHKSGVVLHPNQIAKMNRKQELTAKLEALKNGTWNKNKNKNDDNRKFDPHKNQHKKDKKFDREKVRILARRTSIDWTGKYKDKQVIEVEVDDAVRVVNGGTGVVRYVGPIEFLGDDKNVIGILMDQWHPSYGNGTIDGKKYFDSDDGRGYFAHPPEITENLGSTKPKQEETKSNVEESDNEKPTPEIGQKIKLKDGNEGTVKFVGKTDFSGGQKMIGIELDTWSTNTNSGKVNDKEYFTSNPGRGYFARFSSISDWKIPTSLIEEAKKLDEEDGDNDDTDDPIDSAAHDDGKEIAVSIGDRIVTVRGYTGVVRFKGSVHFDERDVIGIELDQWSPNGHNGIIHGHKYFSCPEGRGYFIRTNGISKNLGPTRRRRKSRTASMMDFGLITKNLKVGDHIRLARGKTGVVKWLGKGGDMNVNGVTNNEDVVGIELDEWSANGNDGKQLFKTSKGRGYFARRASIANIILPNNQFNDLENDEIDIEIQNLKRQIQKVEKKLREIEILEQKQKNGEKLDIQQMAKIDRKKHLKEKLISLKQELAENESNRSAINNFYNSHSGKKARNSLEKNEQLINFTKRRNSINKAESLKNIQIGDRVRLVRGKTGIVKYLGSVDFTDEEVVGIILDKWHPNANNGLVKGKQYFKAPPGRGYFAKKALIIENLGRISSMTMVNYGGRGGGINGIDDESIFSNAPMPKINFKIGDRVKLARGKTGIVKFIGETEFAKGEVIGLQLDTWTPAGHNGTVRGKKYFEAQDGRGYFTRRSSIANVVIPLVKPLKQRRLSITYKLHPLQIGDRIRFISENDRTTNMFNNKTGIIRYIGYPSFANGEVIGIELDEWSVNAHDGSANGIQIFDTSPGRGIFARRDEIEKYDPEKEKLEEIKKNLKLGDTVILTSNRKGHIKYIGPVTGQDEMIGVELESWSPDAKDGRYDGFRYFTAPDGRGVFVKRSHIVDVIPLENDPDIKQAIDLNKDNNSNTKSNSMDEKSKSHDDGKNNNIDDLDSDDLIKQYQVGDRVIIDGGNKGYIRYIGTDTKNEGVYGIELDLAVPQGTDGRHNNKRYFVCRNNHAVFVRKHTIKQIIDEDEIVIPQIGNRIKLTKGRFGIIQSIDEMDDGSLEYNINIDQLIDRTLVQRVDITHRRQHSGNVHSRRLSINNNQIKSGRQSGLLDIEDSAYKKLMSGTVDEDSDNYDSDDDNYTALGETIELRSGKIGTIRFIGPVHFAKGNWIGVELHDNFGPHDGAVRGVRYFTCPPKRGIFVKQIKGRKKDDPTRQHLKRRCPECYGEFIKKRDPRSAYKQVGIVCDGCSKHGNEFSRDDWYFQCGQCEQTDFCLKCMLKLPVVSSDDMLDSYQNIRAKFKPIGTEWIFEDIHNEEDEDDDDDGDDNDDDDDGDAHDKKSIHKDDKLMNKEDGDDDEMKIHGNDNEKSSKFLHASIKSIFDHFDKNNDGKLTDNDINDIYKASKHELDKSLFINKTPMRYQQFEQCWKDISPSAARNILEFISRHMQNQSKQANESIEMLEKVRDIFEFFDRDMDGTLTLNDLENMIPLIDSNWNSSSKTKLLFDPPCDFIKFLAKIQSSSTLIANNILDKLLSFIHLKIEDVFNTFSENKQIMKDIHVKLMYNYSYKKESDWRTTFKFPCNLSAFIENWSTLGIYEQRGILDETQKRIIKRFQFIYDHFNENKINKQQILHLLNINVNNKYFNDLENFDKFVYGINLINRSLTSDILPILENYINKQNNQHAKQSEEKQEEEDNTEQSMIKKIGVTSKRRESSIIQKHLVYRPKLEEVIAKNILDVNPEIDPETAHAMKKLKRVRDMIILNRRIPLRPTPQNLYDRNIAPYGAFDSKGFQQAINAKQRRRDHSIFKLNQLFKDRPEISDLGKIIHPLLRHEHFQNTTSGQESITNPLHHQHGLQQQQKKEEEKERQRQFEQLQYQQQQSLMNKMQSRPTEKELFARNILIDKEHRRRASQNLLHSLSQRPTFSDLVERGILMNENEQFNEKIRELLNVVQSTPNLNHDKKEKVSSITNEIKQDYSTMISRLNGQIFEYKQTLNQFQDDVQSREQTLRQKLENKERVLIHMNGIIEQQRNDIEHIKDEQKQEIEQIKLEYQEKLDKNKFMDDMKTNNSNMNNNNNNNSKNNTEIKQNLEYLRSINNSLQDQLITYASHSNNRPQLQQLQMQKQQLNETIDHITDLALSSSSASSPTRNNENANNKTGDRNNKDTIQLENKLKKQNDEITKLKQQKKEMVKLVNDKMRDLKFIHQQELQKERQIANVLVENHKKEIAALKQRQPSPSNNNHNNNNYDNDQFIQMQKELEQFKKMYNKTLMENESLKKSKKKLEKIVVKLSSDIVQTINKK